MLRTIDEAAEILRCSDAQVRILMRDGQLPYVNIGAGPQRKSLRVTSEALDDFIARRTTSSVAPAKPKRARPSQEWV